MFAALTYTRLFRFFHCFPTFVSILCFFFSFSVTHSSPFLHFHPTGFCDCFQTHPSLYFPSLLCLSSYCTYNLLRAFVSMFLCTLLYTFSSVPSFFTTSLWFSLVSTDTDFQFRLLLLSTCSCFFSTYSSFSSVYLKLFSTIAFTVSDQIRLLEKLQIVL